MKQLYQSLLFAASFFLPRFDCDVFFRVVNKDSSIPQTVNVVLEDKVIRVDKPFSSCSKTDMNASCIFFFTDSLCQCVIPNSAFRLGVTPLTVIFKNGSFCSKPSLVVLYSFINSGPNFYEAAWYLLPPHILFFYPKDFFKNRRR